MMKNFSSQVRKGSKRFWKREGHKDDNLERLAADECEIFSYKALVAATGNFHRENKRQGDVRLIHKGKLKDGREIAVDTVSEPWQQDREEFIRVKELLSSLRHPNVVILFGYCADHCILVYEYVPYSLDKLLSSPNWEKQINWKQRYEIIEGIANGLKYLHSGSQNRIIIHRNINPCSILLDHKWKPIIGGFSRAYQLDEHKTHVNEHVVGISSQCIQYIAPEYWKHRILSVKADLYSFGVLVLELISGQRYQRSKKVRNGEDLLDWAHKLYTENRCLQFTDPTLANSAVPKQVTNCIMIGLLCVQGNPRTRPDMDHVVSMLRGNQGIMEKQIGRPGFLGYGESESSDSDVSSQQPELLQNAYQAFGEAAQNQGNKFEEAVDIGAKIPDYMPVDERQIQDNPSNLNQILKEDKDPQKGHGDENLKKKIAAQNCQKFSYEALYAATSHFSSQNVLGQGGFGVVFKGKLEDEREIAVKKSSKMSEKRRKALIKEVELLSSVKHPNVVKLLGYCVHGNRCLLVYEYVPNKSLDKHLFDPNGRKQDLDWTRTYSMIVSIAEGLSYLHVDPQNCIIHRDIKAGNILLDKKWVPKIADFGISRLFDEDRTHVTATEAVGTLGYMAPEYLELKHVSVKTDVYSFGVLVLELISGKRFNFMPPPPEDNAVGLLDWAYTLFKAGKISNIMDPGLAISAINEQVANCIKIGLLCAQGDPKLRPDMRSVLSMLTLSQIPEMAIGKPGMFGFLDRSVQPI